MLALGSPNAPPCGAVSSRSRPQHANFGATGAQRIMKRPCS
jgi:hypothetical protein